jgi:hypothetical protein
MSTPSTSARGSMTALTRRVRASFAPVQRGAASVPPVFRPAVHGLFHLDAPPAPWVDAGWIENFRRVPGTRLRTLRAGRKAMPAEQAREEGEARVEFDFLQWGKLQMALSGGGQHLNLLAPDLDADPTGATLLPAIALQAGSTAKILAFGSPAADFFVPGDMLAVDVNYNQETGYLGSGIAGAYVAPPAPIGGPGQHYVRQVTFNVGRVESVSDGNVILEAPLLGGPPPAGAAAQKITGFADREGSTFFQEWSALFVIPEESGGRVVFYYPRLRPAEPAREERLPLAAPLAALALHAAFTALPYQDPADGEQVLCHRIYYPAPTAPLY